MSNMHKIIKALCDKNGITIKKLSEDIGVSNSIFTELKYGRTKTLSYSTIQKVSDYFGATPDELILAAVSLGPENEMESQTNSHRKFNINNSQVQLFNCTGLEPWRAIKDEDIVKIFWGEGSIMGLEDLAELRSYARYMVESKKRRLKDG